MQPIQPASPGQPLRASDINAQSNELRRQGNVSFDSGTLSQEAGGVHISVDGPNGFWAIIDSYEDRHYGWNEGYKDEDGYTVIADNRRKGTPKNNYAVEVNYSYNVPSGTVVWMTPAKTKVNEDGTLNQIYNFYYPVNSTYMGLNNVENQDSSISVITDITCDGNGISIVKSRFVATDYGMIAALTLTGLNDFIPKSFYGNENRVLVVNSSGSGVEFGANLNGLGYQSITSFLSLTDTPDSYSGYENATIKVMKNGNNYSLDFYQPSIATSGSLTGGGNPNTYVSVNTLSLNKPIKLINDNDYPEPNQYYGTNNAGQKGWWNLPNV